MLQKSRNFFSDIHVQEELGNSCLCKMDSPWRYFASTSCTHNLLGSLKHVPMCFLTWKHWPLKGLIPSPPLFLGWVIVRQLTQWVEEDPQISFLVIMSNSSHIPWRSHKFCIVSYPNFVWGPFFVGMRPSFEHLKMLNTHRCGIRKVLRCFGKKPVKNTKMEVYLAKWGVCK